MPDELQDMLRRRNAVAVAAMLKVTREELDLALGRLQIDPEPAAAPLPEHTVWQPEDHPAFKRLMALGRSAAEAADAIMAAVRWAVRQGTMHINADGELIDDWDPEVRALPVEWRPA